MTIANNIILHAKVDHEHVLKDLLNTLVQQSLLEKGCQKFELYQHDLERQHFFIVEIWRSEKSYNAHLENDAYKTLYIQVETLLEHQEKHPLKLTQCLTELGLKTKKKAT